MCSSLTQKDTMATLAPTGRMSVGRGAAASSPKALPME
jgi:hypothetical protein